MMKLKIRAALYTAGFVFGVYSAIWLMTTISKLFTTDQIITGGVVIVGLICMYLMYSVILSGLQMDENIKLMEEKYKK